MRGEQLVGVIIAGDEENPTDPIGYAISAEEVYRSISRSMNGMPVRQLTTLENETLAHKAVFGDSQPTVLADLYVHQLFSATAYVGTIQTPLSQSSLTTNDLQTDNAALTAFLKLGRICSSLKRGPTLRNLRLKTSDSMVLGSGSFARNVLHMTQSSSRGRFKRDGEALCERLMQYNEGLAVVSLVVALSELCPTHQTAKALPDTGAVTMLSALMQELRISPLPTPRHTEVLVQAVRKHSTLRAPVDSPVLPVLSRENRVWLARSLARMMFALHTGRFFVHGGRPASTLSAFVGAFYDERVHVVTEDMSQTFGSAVRSAKTYNTEVTYIVPRVFVVDLQTRLGESEACSRYNPFYGDVVEFTELNDLLNNMVDKLKRDDANGVTSRQLLSSSV